MCQIEVVVMELNVKRIKGLVNYSMIGHGSSLCAVEEATTNSKVKCNEGQ